MEYRIANVGDIVDIHRLITTYITTGYKMVEPISDYVVCVDKNRVVGVCCIGHEAGLIEPFTKYNGALAMGWGAVEPEYRGRGILTNLVSEVLRINKPKYIVAEGHINMREGIANADKALVFNGFKLIKTEIGYYQKSGGCAECVYTNTDGCSFCGVSFYERIEK